MELINASYWLCQIQGGEENADFVVINDGAVGPERVVMTLERYLPGLYMSMEGLVSCPEGMKPYSYQEYEDRVKELHDELLAIELREAYAGLVRKGLACVSLDGQELDEYQTFALSLEELDRCLIGLKEDANAFDNAAGSEGT